MKTYFAKLFLIIVILCIIPIDSFGESFLWGKVKWITGSSAIGLEVRLIRNDTNAIVAREYTNEDGSYTFSGIGGQPSDYSLQVFTRNSMKGGIKIPVLSIGSQVPDIIIR
jgi:hypothetical protein